MIQLLLVSEEWEEALRERYSLRKETFLQPRQIPELYEYMTQYPLGKSIQVRRNDLSDLISLFLFCLVPFG